MIEKYKSMRRKWRERAAMLHHAYPDGFTQSKVTLGKLRSRSDTSVALIIDRAQQSRRNHKVKITLPAMPWDKEPQT